MKENSIEEDITRVKQRIEDVKEYIEYGLPYSEYLDLENSFDNILSDYKRVLKENEEKDKIIDLLIKELYTKAHISTRCYLQTSTEECMKYKNCYECLKKHFENKERRNNGKGN